MIHNVSKGEKPDFSQRFQIGSGTGTDATMDRVNEVTIFLFHDMDDMSSHFCKVYDREFKRMIDGHDWKQAFRAGDDPINSDAWRLW